MSAYWLWVTQTAIAWNLWWGTDNFPVPGTCIGWNEL